ADEVCTTSACVTAAAGILADVDQSVDPCEDFFQYSCGGWLSSHDIASDRGDYFTSSIMAEDSQRLSRNILEGTFVGSSAAERAIWEKASGVYSACMDTDRIAEVGGEPIYPILEKIQAVYPLYAGALESVRTWVEGPSEVMVKDEARTSAMDLTDAVLYLQTMAITALIQFDIDADDMDPDFTVLRLYQVMNGLPSKEYYTRPSITIPYTDAIKQVFANVLADVNTTLTPRQLDDRYAALAEQVVEFEAQLAAISLDFEELFDGSKTYHPFTISDLQKTFTPVEFTYLIQSMTGSPTMPGQVIVTYPQYLIDLNKLIPTVSRETLQTYFMWKAIEVYAGHLSDSVARPVTEFRNALRGISSTVRPDRWKTCVAEVDSLTGWILGKYYTDRAFSPVAKEMGEEIINGIKDAFVDKLNVLPWMDVNTKGVAIEKVHRLVQKIGYPDQSPDIKSADSLADYYKDLKISATDYFGNYKSARMQAAVDEWQSLGKPTDRAAWGMTPSTVNAYYNPPLGEIVFPAGILQPPVFSEHQPSYMNYGAFGAVAGHELSHAFDNQGRAYDENGRLHDWWTPKTSQEFDTRAQCFIDQYSEYTVVDDEGNVLHVNGKFTEGENIADNGGIAAAFNAWKTHEAREPSPLLPGVNMTKEQLFFVNYARWWCGKTRPGTAAQRIYTDPHSPSFVRVLAAAEDSQDFIDAFQCKNKSPRCVLW
ncbi:endothelin-converting enzyme, partial [Myxozyma melibiosi]